VPSAVIVLGLRRAQEDSPRAVAEQHAGAAVLPVQDTGIDLAADHQNAAGLPGSDHPVGHGQAIDETGARGGKVEPKALGHPQLRLHAQRGGGKRLVGRAGRQDDPVHIRRRRAGIGQGRPGRRCSHERRGLMLAGEVPLFDARPFLNPGVGGIDRPRQLFIGHDPLGQVAATAGEDGTRRH
jgi:hypothetical protein